MTKMTMLKTTNSNCNKTQIKKHFCLPFNQFLKLQNLKSIDRIFVFTSLFFPQSLRWWVKVSRWRLISREKSIKLLSPLGFELWNLLRSYKLKQIIIKVLQNKQKDEGNQYSLNYVEFMYLCLRKIIKIIFRSEN